ncbi:uncharacterized protein LOC118531852 [Halichoerus grypus]
MAQVPALGQSRLCSATPSAEKPTLPQDLPSTLVRRSPERSTQDRRTDSDFPPGYLFHALQTTLWTFSLLFKSPPGEGGKKKSRGDPSQLERKKKKKFKRVSTAAKKPRLCRPSNDNRAFRRVRGDRFPPRPGQKPGTPSHTAPLSGRRDFNSTTGRPPSWSWASTEIKHLLPAPRLQDLSSPKEMGRGPNAKVALPESRTPSRWPRAGRRSHTSVAFTDAGGSSARARSPIPLPYPQSETPISPGPGWLHTCGHRGGAVRARRENAAGIEVGPPTDAAPDPREQIFTELPSSGPQGTDLLPGSPRTLGLLQCPAAPLFPVTGLGRKTWAEASGGLGRPFPPAPAS